MYQYDKLTEKLKTIFDPADIRYNEPMKNHTSFRVGGPVDFLVMPANYEQVRKVTLMCKEYNIPYYIVGNGTNLLVRDGGIRGIAIKLTRLDDIKVEGEKITASCGALLSEVSNQALCYELTGVEFACGIPGSVGGAIAMNAGAYDGEICHIVESALVIDDTGTLRRLSNSELEFGYRNSAILKYGYTVLEVVFSLKHGEYERIKNRIDELTRRRKEKQPLEFPSAGSTFKRPEGYFTGKLIQDSGLKGICVGDAQVSDKHSGFIINKGNATASEILQLISYVQSQVREQFSVELHPEVRIIGEEESL